MKYMLIYILVGATPHLTIVGIYENLAVCKTAAFIINKPFQEAAIALLSPLDVQQNQKFIKTPKIDSEVTGPASCIPAPMK